MVQGLAEQRTATGSFSVTSSSRSSRPPTAERDNGTRDCDASMTASRLTETNLERVYAAELWRVKGELLLGKGAGTSKRGQRAATRAVVDARAMLPPRSGHRSEARGPIARPPRRDEPGTLGQRRGRSPGSARAPPLDIHLIHGRVRHERPHRGQGAPAPRTVTGVIALASVVSGGVRDQVGTELTRPKPSMSRPRHSCTAWLSSACASTASATGRRAGATARV